ncbi:hypothetical protein PV325_011900 [Microctonus aethiopoides]|nr:hypothetical protein PV325_011900 [Microctonus aethiopoides]
MCRAPVHVVCGVLQHTCANVQLLVGIAFGKLIMREYSGATRNRDESDKTDDLSNVDTVLIIPSFDNGFGRSGFGLGRIDLDDDEDATPFNPFHFNFRPIHNPFSGIWENLQSK